MEFNPNISLFKNAGTSVPYAATPSVLKMLELIQNGRYIVEVENVRTATNKADRDELKKKLNGVTWSATFNKKRNSDLQYVSAYSQLICHDIDKLDPEQLTAIKNKLSTDKFVYACFVSPSGNGLKVLFRTATDIADFLPTWNAIANYIEIQFSEYNVLVDQKCKDISRLCFVSYDPDLHHYEAAKPIDDEFVEKWAPITIKRSIPASVPPPLTPASGEPDINETLKKINDIVIKTVTPCEGSYNAYINQFAIQSIRFDLTENECADGICIYCNWASADKNDIAVIKSVYEKFRSERGKYKNEKPIQNTVESQTEKTPVVQQTIFKEVATYNTSVKFWYMVARMDKEGTIIKDQQGHEVGEYKYSYDDAITFLQNNGFYKYKVGSGYQFIQVDKVNKQVEIVDELRIKEFMIDFLKSNNSNEYKRVREMFRRGAKNYCSTGILEGMDYFNPDLNRDTSTNAYIYFKNCFLDISKVGIYKKQYKDQKGYIWKRQMLDFEYAITDFSTSDTNLFLWYAVTGRKCDYNERTPEEIEKYNALCSTIGYTLHRYKSPALTKAVITTDKKLRSTGENNGRSGKSLVVKLISHMLNVVTIDGRNFSFDKDFNLQKVNVDTALINFDDVKPSFDFSRLFSLITDEFSFEKKRIDLITIPFSDAPKFLISSNSTLKGGGESAIARQQIIEFSSYFNSAHSPAKEFGRMFFHEWDKEEWQRYYCFMVQCVKQYLDNGLLTFPLENYGLNKLIDTAGEDFVDYMDDTVLSHSKLTTDYDATALYEKYLELTKANKYPPKKNTFTKWVKQWAELHELIINGDKPDGRDRRNGTDYLKFTPKNAPESNEKLPF